MKSKIEIREMLNGKKFMMQSKSNFNCEEHKREVAIQIEVLEWVLS